MQKRIVGDKDSNLFKRIGRSEKAFHKLLAILIKKGIIKEEDLK